MSQNSEMSIPAPAAAKTDGFKLYRDASCTTPTINGFISAHSVGAKSNEAFAEKIADRIADPADIAKKLHGLLLWSRCRKVSGIVKVVTTDPATGFQDKTSIRTTTRPVVDMRVYKNFPAAVAAETAALFATVPAGATAISYGFSFHSVDPRPAPEPTPEPLA